MALKYMICAFKDKYLQNFGYCCTPDISQCAHVDKSKLLELNFADKEEKKIHNNSKKNKTKQETQNTLTLARSVFFGVKQQKWIYKWNHCESPFSNWRSNKQVAHHSLGTAPALYQPKGILSIIEKKVGSRLSTPQTQWRRNVPRSSSPIQLVSSQDYSPVALVCHSATEPEGKPRGPEWRGAASLHSAQHQRGRGPESSLFDRRLLWWRESSPVLRGPSSGWAPSSLEDLPSMNMDGFFAPASLRFRVGVCGASIETNWKNAGGLQSGGEPLFTELNKVLDIDRADRNSAAHSRLRSPGSDLWGPEVCFWRTASVWPHISIGHVTLDSCGTFRTASADQSAAQACGTVNRSVCRPNKPNK